ncbi:MAG: hypothetical protein CL869_03685 [Cytophagia bacterium]|nr:hypothetical protein [Cytophagia bacterium]
MDIIKYYILFFFLSILPIICFSQTIRINEAVSSNSNFIDEDGDSPDWFELYNYGNQSVSLKNWTISDKDDIPDKWTFPDISINPDEYLLIWASGKDRGNSNIFRTLINWGDEFKYIIPDSQTPNNWRDPNFDDSDWQTGKSGFGYGDGDDETIIPNGTLSLFLRKTFNLNDVNDIESLILDVDYDDAFVAYINGIEVGRKNIGGNPPFYNSVPYTDHESAIYQNGKPDRITITNFDGIINSGDNIFALQAHNVSNTSSDFTIIPFLSISLKDNNSDIGILPPEILGLNNDNLHTNFKISSEGENLSLYDNNGNKISELNVIGVPTDVSLGISQNNNIVHFTTPTPGFENSLNFYQGSNLTNITFSHEGGSFTGELNLSFSGTSGNEVIRYTLDASEPNENSIIYSGPININKTTIVRARVFESGYIPSYTQSRAFIYNVNHTLPIVSLITDPHNLFDNEDGIYVFGDSYDQNYPHFGANFWEDWERPIHFSLYENNSNYETSFNGGVKIFGGWSRGQAQRSFSFFARSKYGSSEINYKLFPQLDYSEFQSFILRNSGQDWLRTSVKDAALTSLLKGTGLDYQSYRPVVTYINGEYWGIYNLREKVNEHFIASKHNLDPDDIDLLTNNSELVHGSSDGYEELINFVSSNDLSIEENYNYVKDRIDVDNYIIYQVSQIYFNNHDWPGNNIKYWKHKEGKWKWIIYDTDFGFGSFPSWLGYNYNTLNFALTANGPNWPNPPWSTLLFRKMVENLEFRNMFINRYADELNSRFLPHRFSNHIDSLINNIKIEIPSHFNRWNSYVQNWNYQDYVNDMKNFSNNRPQFSRNHILSSFNLPNIQNLLLDIENLEMGSVQLNNNLLINENNWSGKYFESVPIKILAIAKSGYSFSHWSDESLFIYEDLDLNNPELIIDLKHHSKFKAHFKLAPLSIENSTFINNVYPNPTHNKIKVNIKSGINIKDVYLVDLNGKKFKPKALNRHKDILELNVSNLSIGIYLLELVTDKEINKLKVIIERK